MIDIELANQQIAHEFDAERLTSAARAVLADESVRGGTLSIAVVDDKTMRRLNRRYLQHDYATDVLSFLLDSAPGWLQGEVIVSADTAAKQAPRFGWTTEDELLLYVIHGTLHLVGYDDKTTAAARRMRTREQAHLSRFVPERAEPPPEKPAAARRRRRPRAPQ